MDRSRYRALAVAGTLLIAGCGGLLGSPPGTSTPTATPAPVPTPSPTASPTPAPPAEVAPGVGEDGLTRPRALAAAHVRSLNSPTSFVTAYELRTGYVERAPNGTVTLRVRARHAVETPRSRHRVAWNGDATGLFDVGTPPGPGRADTYCEIGRCVLALTVDNATRYRDRGLFGPALYTAVTKDGLGAFLSSAERSAVRPVDRNGSTRYRVRTVGVEDASTVPTADRVETVGNVSFTALVTPSGFIRTYRLAYTGRRDGRRVRVAVTVRFTGVGEATVERPAWFDEAKAATEGATPTARNRTRLRGS